jgi:FKBP-type peptidyl-prolyl cis-trans isomerase FklB
MMKLVSFAVIFALLVSLDASAQLKDKKDKISYSIGVNISKSLKRQDVDINLDLLFQGFKDGYSDAKLLMSEQEIQDTLMAFQKESMAKQAEKAKILGEENEKKGEVFLAENKKKDSVVTLPDGLQYKILRDGTGKTPTLEDTVTVQYRGSLIDGTEFDNSYKRGQPASFTLPGVIKGWQEALQLMKTGAKWQIFIPSNLGYGEKGYGSVIPPNSVLIFEIELISFK